MRKPLTNQTEKTTKNIISNKCNEEAFLPILHHSRVELRCKFQEKLNCVTAL